MSTKEELIIENELLKRKLALAEAWMRKEVVHQKKKLGEQSIKSSKRKQLDNMFESESVDIITRKIENYFGDSLETAPKFTINHLIDAEIYWQTLQKFPSLDALPIVSSYQKILESFFEKIIEGFRNYVQKKDSLSYLEKLKGEITRQSGFDRDIENVLEKKYSLSLGRWFQFFEKVRNGEDFGGVYEDLFLEYLSQYHQEILESCIVEPIFGEFSELIHLEVFSKKRHETKVSYRDAEKTRQICMNIVREKSLLFNLFR